MTRLEFQQLAETRVADAQLLLNAQRWDAAYYLIGYSVECGLKACIAKAFKQDDIPDKGFVSNIFSHDLAHLLRLAEIQKHMPSNSPLEVLFVSGLRRPDTNLAKASLTQSRYLLPSQMRRTEFYHG